MSHPVVDSRLIRPIREPLGALAQPTDERAIANSHGIGCDRPRSSVVLGPAAGAIEMETTLAIGLGFPSMPLMAQVHWVSPTPLLSGEW